MDEIKKENENKKTILDKSIDFIFSNSPMKWLALIFILGVVLRFLVASNISALGDEMVHGPHAIGFLHSGLISTILHSPLWFYLTDIALKIFGVTLFSTRFLSFFFGSLTILVVYLISSKIFNKKAGLISALLISLSYFTIRYTLMEMDLAATFFLFLAIYLFIISIEDKKFPIWAAVSIGLAALIKTLSLFFVPAFLIAFFIFRKDLKFKKNFKSAIYFGLIILLFFSPILIHNYLWYHDSRMVDTYLAQYFDIGAARQAYAGQLGYDSGFLEEKFFQGLGVVFGWFISSDPIITVAGLLGIIFSFIFINQRKYSLFLIIFETFGLVLLILSNWLPTHYTTLIPALAIFGGFSIVTLSHKIKISDPNKIIVIAVTLILVFQLYVLMPHLTSEAAIGQVRSYALANFDKNSVVVVDSRLYRGRMVWAFYDFHYLESAYLSQVIETNKNLPGTDQPIKMYFIECAIDDCAWGTVTNGSFNDSSEQIVSAFSSQSPPEKIILGGGGYNEETGSPYFKIYSTTINLKPSVFELIDSTHEWFYYPVNYIPKEKIFDRYQLYKVNDPWIIQILNILLFNLAKLIIWISIVLAIVMPPIFLVKFFKHEK